MAKQLNVNLAFTADTSRAKQQMQDLQNSLNNLMKTNISSDSNLGFSKQIVEAKGAVADLKIALDSAKSSTGGLDLSKFNESLIKSGRTLESYRKDLIKLGPEGESTFLKLAQSIVSAEAPLKRSSRLLTEFSTTLKNTVRWQISSSILHGFMGSVQSAVGYAQDLNESLNNIRIVTGNNTEQMAKFANEANKAAKALSTTTTAYTDAALIYYQQGLDDTQVKERTDITIKMANVSRQSAEEVSDQLTAVWNNFAKGSESLEHFADVMTRLGADTASSSDEIAQGLEKFSAIADMIGLSFDNAAAALATVTATTRQSADVVGTAFKTIFARIQGLSLGETLDDGTNLNKYSKALNAVGINIKEQNGELKDMDSILAEMGAKWDTLSKDQQVALAQTVAGVRQYNQLIALMDHFDFYEQNLSAAQNSTGTLQEQADIYAESWEAARDRVKAASQAIYSDLLDDKFFITILNGLEKILTGIDNLIDGIGGLRTILPLVITLMTKLYGQGMADSIDRITFNIFKNTKQFQDSIKQMREDAKEEASKLYANTGTEAGNVKLENIKQQINLQNKLNDLAKDLSDTQLKELQNRLDIIKTYDDQAVKMAEIKDKASDDLSDSREKLVQKALRSNNSSDSSKTIRSNLLEIQRMEEASQKAQIKLQQLNNEFSKSDTDINKFKSGIKKIKQELINAGFDKTSQAVQSLDAALRKTKLENFKAQVEELIHGNELADSSFLDIDNRVTELSQKYEWTQKETDLFRQKVQELTNSSYNLDDALRGAAEAVEDYEKKVAAAKQAMQQLGTFGNTMISVFQGVSSITAGISSLVNIIETLNNEDATGLEQFRTVIMGLSMGLPMFISGCSQLIEINKKWKTSMDAVNVGETTNIALLATHIIAQKAQTIATNAQDKSLKKLIATTISWMAVNAPVLLILLAIAAAVGALIGVIKLVSLAWDKWKASTPEGQLETLKEKAEESAEAFNRVQEAVNQTKQAIESLKSTYDTIDGLTQGTNEWRDAILDANAQVLKLLEAYPDLSEFIYNDKGLLRINDAGYEMIDNTNRSRMQAAYNQQINDQQKVTQKEIDNSYIKGFKDQNNKTLSSSYAKALQQIYDQIGESLFTEAYSEEILADLNNAGFANQYDKEDFYNIIKANENVLKENANRSKKINNLENSKLEMAASQIGSNRSANEIRDIMGETTYSSIKSQKKQDIVSSFDKNGWNSYIDYKEGSDQWQSIQDFLSVKGGENAKYVGQKGGKLAIEIDGEEYQYSASEFYDTLAELYTSQEYQQQFENKIRDSLSGTFGNAINDLDIEDVTSIDNFKKNLVDNLTNLGTDEETSNKIFESLASLYKDNENPLQGIQNFASSTQYIDTTSEAFLNLANALTQTNDQAEKLSIKEQIEELNAQGQIDSMSEYFSSEAESMGLDKDAGKEMQDYAKNLLDVADESELLDDRLSSNADAAAEVAKSVTRMNKGIDTLADNFEDWNSILKKSDKSSAEYSKAISGMKDALGDVLDVESDIIDNDFIEDHLEEIKKAANGDADAIDALKEALAEDILLEVVGVSKFDDVNQDIQNLHDSITTMDNEIKVGATLEDGDFLEAANNLVSTAGMTVDEAQAYFNSLGYEPEFVTEEQTVKRSIPQETTHTDYAITPGTIDIMGAKVPIPTIDRITTTRITGYEDLDEVVQVPAMSADGTPQIKKLTKTSSGAMNNYSSSNKGGKAPGSSKGGGGGSKGKKPSPVSKDKVVDRYKEITDSLELVTDAFDDAGKAADRLYGANKLNAMKKQNDLVLKEIELLKEKKKWALEYLKEDTKILEEAAKKAGVGILFNEDGNIANYTQIMTVLFNELKAATDAAGAEIDDAEQEAIDAIQAKIDNLKEAIAQYDDTNATYREIENTIEDRFDDWQQRNYDMINYEMEVKNDLLDREQKIIDTQIKILGDSFYKMAEVAQEYLNKRPIFEQSGDNAKDMYNKATQQYNDNMINDDQYIELLKTSQDALMDNIDSLLDLDETMKNYYSETLSAAQDELSKYTDQLEHLTSVLDHYRSLLDLVGRNKDHETIGKILETSLNNSKNLYAIAKENYDDLAARTERMRKKLEDESLGEKEREQLYDEYMNLVALTAEAEETMYSHLEDIGNKAAEIFSNTMDKIRTEFEATLSDSWKSFNELNTQIDHLTTSQSEYLTKTNQLYETNKLIRQATLDMNDIENAQSKQKYKDYIKYIENLQKSEKLSQAELQIAQAKYELLQAQINLEDAQNAKDNVRMVKDNEGNWGYVYTADQDKISEAQQQYEDAQNNLYNISLQGIQDYQSKISQAMQKAYDEQQSITEAYKRGEIASWEEYQQKLQESRTYWFDYMKDLYNEYGIYEQTMLEYSAEGYQDYTTVNIGSIESFQEAYTNSMNSQMEAANEWKENTDIISEEIGQDYDETSQKIDEVEQASDSLTEYTLEEVIPAIQKECDAVEELSNEWASHRDEVYDTIESYRELIAEMQRAMAMAAMASLASSSLPVETPQNTPTSSGENNKGGGKSSTASNVQEIINGVHTGTIKQTTAGWKPSAKAAGYSDQEISLALKALNDSKSGGGYSYDYDKALQIAATFASGGYTGEWGPEAKWALLHEKEQILTAEQTEKFFNLANRILDFSNLIDQNANSQSIGLSSLLTKTLINNNEQQLRQEVKIEASFPNATDKNEILDAFDNLINLASQYANRKI